LIINSAYKGQKIAPVFFLQMQGILVV